MTDARVEIRWIEGELPRVVDEAEAVLLQNGEQFYQRGAMIVRVVRRKALSARNFNRADGALGLVMVDPPYLVETLTRSANWRRYDKRRDEWRPINCPDRVAVHYLARSGSWRLPRLWAAINAPTVRPDGSVLQEPGHDPSTGILYDPGEVEFGAVAEKPTRLAAELALAILRDAIKSFPFAEEVDRAVALSLILTALVRRSLPSAPLGAITAPIMGSGKTLLADVIAIIGSGVSAPVMVHPSNDDEARKLLLSILAEGECVVLIDNIERPLSGEWLCTVLTSETFQDRLLGRNVLAQVPTSTLFLATGNQLVLVGDLRTRALLCRIDPKCEHPEEREFAVDLRDTVMKHRPRLVQAALTIIRAFVVSGTAPSDCVKPWGRFEHWSALVRAPLVWLGVQDPCATVKLLEKDDPDRARHLAMLRAWRDCFGAEPHTLREALDRAVQAGASELREALELVGRDRRGELDLLRFGKWMQRIAGRIAGGLQFQRAGERRGSALWQVMGD